MEEELNEVQTGCPEFCSFPDHIPDLDVEPSCVRGFDAHHMHVCAVCFSPHTEYTAHDRLVRRHADDWWRLR